MRLPKHIFLGTFLVLPFALCGELRTWTDSNGQTMEAGFIQYLEKEEKVAILRNGLEYQVPLGRFSQPDQEYILQEHAKFHKPPAARAEELKGLQASASFRTRAFSTPEGYFGDPNVVRFVRAFKWSNRTHLESLGYDPLLEKMAIFVPPNYDHTIPFGVYVAISPGNKAWIPNKAYQEVLTRHRLISVSVHNSGNGQGIFRRTGLALDALATVHLLHKTDPARFYVGGVSGGGITATHAHFLYPKHFKASFNIVRGALPDPFEVPIDVPGKYKKGQVFGNAWPYLSSEDWKRLALQRPDSRWIFLSGTKDYNYEFAKASAPQWRNKGFQSKFFDVPGLGHQNVPAEWFEKALLWAEVKSEPK